MATTTNTTATAAASSAASGRDSKSKVPALQTPVSASYPSELRSPLPGTAAFIKREECVKTPITPPSAYLDFLKNVSPALMSPPTTSSTSRFPSMDKSTSDHASFEDPRIITLESTTSPPSSLSRQTSSGSTTSISSVSTTSTKSLACTTATAGPSSERTKPQSPRIIIPPSPFIKPTSARTPRRLHIPQSPFSATDPISACSMQSPYSASASALGNTPWSATFSNAASAFPSTTPLTSKANGNDDVATDISRSFGDRDVVKGGSGKNSKVCVRQVVTRTVTYCRTPLDPAPKGKRRKIEGQETVGGEVGRRESKEESPESGSGAGSKS